MPESDDIATCPNCGAPIPPKAMACPECGSDEKTGWSEEAAMSALGLPEEEFNYDEFAAREFDAVQSKPHGMSWFWWVMAVIVLVAMLVILFRAR